MATAFADDGFAKANTEWFKLTLAVAEDASALASRLQTLAIEHSAINSFTQQFAAALTTEGITNDIETIATIEQSLWPAKVIDAAIPSFLVPIKPFWAQELFDSTLADQTLFGSMKQLALNREGVYYRAARPRVLTAPARILWYVSQDRSGGYAGSGAIRACSQLNEVIEGLPKELFRRFRRLGIYEWQHVYKAAGEDINKPIMAIRFSNTELFPHPVGLPVMKALYEAHGRGAPMLQGPSQLPAASLFAALYNQGMQRNGV